MRYGKLTVALFSVMLLLLAALCLVIQPAAEIPEKMPLSFSIHTDTNTENLSCWQSDDGCWYVFLPSYGTMENLSVSLESGAACTLDGRSVTDRQSCRDFRLDTPYSLTWGKGSESSLIFVKSGQMPALHINVQSGSMEYIHMEKGNQEQGRMRLYREDGTLDYSGVLTSVQGRGNSSWNAEKKPYSLTLEQAGDLLGMGQADRWILLAEGHNAVNLRNKIVYDFVRNTGLSYTPDCRWVDLYLNGEYAGLYLLTERNEIHPERVDIPEDGSFLVSLEIRRNLENQKIPYVPLESGQALRIRSTKMTEQELKQLLQPVENAILAKNGVDPITGKHWTELIDLDSWVRKFLVEEVFANPDGGAVSQYFYYRSDDPEGKLYAGPVWDYDFSMGGEWFWMREYDSYFTINKDCDDAGNWFPWFYELYRKELFHQRVRELFESEFLPALQELMEDGLDTYGMYIGAAMKTDGIRWNASGNVWASELKFIQKFLERRTAFLIDLWINGSEYHTVRVYPGKQSSGFFAVKNGDTLPQLPSYEEVGGIGWYTMDTDEPFDITQPIRADAEIYVKKRENPLPLIHIAPVAAVVVLLAGLVLLDTCRTKKNGRNDHDRK